MKKKKREIQHHGKYLQNNKYNSEDEKKRVQLLGNYRLGKQLQFFVLSGGKNFGMEKIIHT